MLPKPLLLLAAAAVLIVLGGALPLILRRKAPPSDASPFKKTDRFLTAAERSFFEVLVSLLDSQWLVMAKVRLADLVYLPKGTTGRQSWLNRVNAKHVDFVLCDRQSMTPWLVVELDDSSHQRADRQERDALVDQILNGAGLPVLHVSVKKGYSPDQISQMVNEKLQSISTPNPA